MKRWLELLALNKAHCLNHIFDNFFKDTHHKIKIIKRQKQNFLKYLRKSEISEYFIEAKLIIYE